MSLATLHLDTSNNVGLIDPRIFSGFLEHLGRAIYGGVYDPGNPLSDERGFRRDVIDALRPLGMPCIRYPGGNFVSCYDWKDGIGDRKARPRRPDYAWRSIETNQFGTDEFVQWCQQVGSEPMMAVNLGTGSPASAAELVEYCNLNAGTYWADRRIANGSREPYGIKLWCLGNEMDGPWQAGHCTADVYAQRAYAASKMMKGMDPTIQTIVCGSSGRFMPTYLSWDRTVLEHCWDEVDYISAHRYSRNDQQDSAWFLAEGIEIERIIEDYAGLIDYVRGVRRSNKRIYVCFDEWNVWYRERGGDGQWQQAPHLLEEMFNLEDALVCAQYLSAFVRRSDVVRIACIAQIVNVIAPIMTRQDGILVQGSYWPLAWFSQHARGISLRPVLTSPTYEAGERGECPMLDVAASFDASTGEVVVFATNRSEEAAVDLGITLGDRQPIRVIAVYHLTGATVKTVNTWENPYAIRPQQLQATVSEGRVKVSIPKISFVTIRLETLAR